VQKADTSGTMVDIHSCETLFSGLWKASYWPKNGLRTQKQSSGGTCPHTPSV